jgi:sterol desaturase/sphingolipid hydroxylase (fatty acid hydroxylase superfamily)
MNTLLENASQIYAFVFFGGITVMALLEWTLPRRRAGASPGLRWFGNFSLTILGMVLVRALLPLVGVGWALYCRERGLGLFNAVSVPGWLAFVVTILTLDVVSYAQHYVLHRVPVLWRVHRTHHSDLECDFSTGVRFHPLEAVYASLVMMGAIAVLGAPPAGVFVSQLLSVALDFVEHANLRIPPSLDRALRLMIVTPDMHHVHHSQDVREGNANFSNTFPWWDRLFGTYLEQPAAGHDGMTFGVKELAEPKHLRLHWMLAQPFLTSKKPAAPVGSTPAEHGHQPV